MYILIDILLAVLIIVFAVASFKKGFISSLLSFFGTAISWVFAVILSGPTSTWIYSTLIKSSMTKMLTERITEASNTAFDSLYNSIPQFIVNTAKTINIDLDSVLISNTDKSVEIAVNGINNGIVSPVITLIIRAAIAILLLILFTFIIRKLIKLFKLVNKIPLIGPLNRFLGIVFGILEGCLVTAIVCIVFSIVLDIAGGQIFSINESVLNSTIIFKFFEQFNPIV